MTEPNQPINPETNQQKTEPNQPVNQEINQPKTEPTEPINPEINQQKTEPNQPVNQEINQQKTKPTEPINQEINQPKIEPSEPINQEIKQQKTEPNQPVNQEINQQKTEPTEPINPEINQQQIEPSEPINPEINQQKVEPTEPINQEINQQQIEPSEPINPEINQQKVEPNQPVNPEIKQQKVEPNQPVNPEIKQQKVEPSEPVKPEIKQQKVEPSQPIKPENKQQKTEPSQPINQEINKQKYEYDPHLDPQLNWAGKTEHTSFEVPTVSLHVHEKIDPYSIIEAIKNPDYKPEDSFAYEAEEEEPPKKPSKEKKLNFYQHQKNWSNRLITGDSLLIMNSLLHKEGMAGKVQTIYIDPPYGIKYGSNFQPFVNNRDVKNGSDEDLTQSPETIKAFRDTWELGVHSYLTYLRDRLLLARELLDETGSCFVQISEANVHFVRNLMDEVFGRENLCSEISFIKATGLTARLLKRVSDYIIWYAKSKKYVKYRQLYKDKMDLLGYTHIEMPDGTVRTLSTEERIRPTLLPPEGRPYRTDNLSSAGGVVYTCLFDYTFQGKTYSPPQNRSWKTNPQGMEVLEKAGRLIAGRQSLRFLKYADDLTVSEVDNLWTDTGGPSDKTYVVQTSRKVIQRCMLMTTDPGDLVLDITCGSGTTAYVAEQWGRRWITCDTSRVAITLAKQRLMTGVFDFYQLTNPTEGISSGFKYKTVPHITLKSITNNPEIREGMTREEITKALRKYALIETLYDRPFTDRAQIRVSGPFTVEAVPAPVVKSVDKIVPEEINNEENGHNLYPKIEPDFSIVRTGETLRQAEWREELLKTGIRAKNAQKIEFSSVEPLPGTQFLHALAETKEYPHQRVVISFGYEYAPLEKTQIELAISEAKQLIPKPEMIVFAAFEFDPEAARNIDEINSEGLRLLKVQINGDLLTEDLKKKRATNESFWLLGQPDVKLQKIAEITDKEVYKVEVLGFDYYNTKTGKIESGGKAKIAMWLLDTDYNGSCMFAKQVFFPMGGYRDGLDKLAKSLKAEIDEDLFAVYRSTVSRPFELGKYRRVAVKIVDDRGLESLKVIKVG